MVVLHQLDDQVCLLPVYVSYEPAFRFLRAIVFNRSFREDVVQISDVVVGPFGFDTSSLLDQVLRRFAESIGAAAAFLLASPAQAEDRIVTAYVRRADSRTIDANQLAGDLKDELSAHLDSFDCDEPLFWAGEAHAPILVSRWDESSRLSYYFVLSFDRQKDAADRRAIEHCVGLFFPLLQLHLKTLAELETMTRSFDGMRGVLDNSEVAIILFSREGRMILSNKAATDIVEAQDGLRMGGRGPTPTSLRAAARFQIALEHAIAENGRPGRMGNGRGSAVMKIPREEGRRPLIAALSRRRRRRRCRAIRPSYSICSIRRWSIPSSWSRSASFTNCRRWKRVSPAISQLA